MTQHSELTKRSSTLPRVGVLALQGCIRPHLEKLKILGASATRITHPSQLESIDRLILPGGESTTMLKFLEKDSFFEKLQAFCQTHPTWGICAGSILLAHEVINPPQRSLNLIPLRAHRNYYGSQRESFSESITFLPTGTTIEAQFIRAPRLEALSDEVTVLATVHSDGGHGDSNHSDPGHKASARNNPVCFRYRNILASSFHTELGEDLTLHSFFLTGLSAFS